MDSVTKFTNNSISFEYGEGLTGEDLVTTIIYYITSFIVIILCLIFINSKL